MYIYEKRQIDFFNFYLPDSINIQLYESESRKRKRLRFYSQSFKFFGGDGRDRTDDLHTASVALSQLSYAPICSQTVDFASFRYAFYIQLSNALRGSLPVGLRSQLSYAPVKFCEVIIAYPFLLCKHFFHFRFEYLCSVI